MEIMTGLKAPESRLRLFPFPQPQFSKDEEKTDFSEHTDMIESPVSISFRN
jgi:hypothetical protein